MKLAGLIITLCLLMPSVAAAATTPQEIARRARDAYERKQYEDYLAAMQELLAARPGHPRILFNLAGAHALNGEEKEAMRLLSRVAAMGLYYPAAKDEDFLSLRDQEEFQKLSSRFQQNLEPTSNSRLAVTLPLTGTLPEGVAYDSRTGDYFVGTVHQRTLYRRSANGKVTEVKLGPAEQIWSITGLKMDPRTRTLWIAMAGTTQMRSSSPELVGRSAILAYDVDKKRIRSRFELKENEPPHWLGDLTLSPAGEVFATDSRTAAIYRLDAASKKLEPWLTDERLVSPQGLVFAPNGTALYVADYTNGIWRVDTKSRTMSLLPVPEESTLLGIDGLYLHEGRLIAIQNGTNPHRIVAAQLDGSGKHITAVEILESNHRQFDEPTLGVIIGDELHYIATSQWGGFQDDGTLREGIEPKEVLVLKLKL